MNSNKILGLVTLIVLLISIPIGIFLVSREQELRERASEDVQASLHFTPTDQINIDFNQLVMNEGETKDFYVILRTHNNPTGGGLIGTNGFDFTLATTGPIKIQNVQAGPALPEFDLEVVNQISDDNTSLRLAHVRTATEYPNGYEGFATILLVTLSSETSGEGTIAFSDTTIISPSYDTPLSTSTATVNYTIESPTSPTPTPSPSPTPTLSPSPSPDVCAQIITPAVDPETGECREFPTPCDVPEGWETLPGSSCPVSSPSPSPSPSPGTGGQPTPTPGTEGTSLSLNLYFQEIRQQGRSQEITIILTGADGSTNEVQINAASGTGGIYTTDPISVSPGIYTIKVKGQSHLARNFGEITVSTGNNVLNLDQSPLLAGDVTDDNRIDLDDYTILISHFGTRMPTGGSPADLTFDGKIDLDDYALLVNNFGQQGD